MDKRDYCSYSVTFFPELFQYFLGTWRGRKGGGKEGGRVFNPFRYILFLPFYILVIYFIFFMFIAQPYPNLCQKFRFSKIRECGPIFLFRLRRVVCTNLSSEILTILPRIRIL